MSAAHLWADMRRISILVLYACCILYLLSVQFQTGLYICRRHPKHDKSGPSVVIVNCLCVQVHVHLYPSHEKNSNSPTNWSPSIIVRGIFCPSKAPFSDFEVINSPTFAKTHRKLIYRKDPNFDNWPPYGDSDDVIRDSSFAGGMNQSDFG